MRLVLWMVTLWMLPLSMLLSGGCAHHDAVLRNPLARHPMVPTTLARAHRKAERTHGLSSGTLTDWVSLGKLDASEACFDVVLRALRPLDLRVVHATLEVPEQPSLDQASLWPQEPTHTERRGLVLTTVEHGFSSECAKHDPAGICLTYTQKPTYRTIARPGTVSIYEALGRMCFPNASSITATTRELRLALALPGEAAEQYRFRLAP
ncbi:MAG: hypothetical protein ABI321_09950 [Polyangia bacterium]